ncbi:MAG: acetyl-CoA carboxylase biotin carboxyl carrier protein [Planctomycetota bacterium]|nr:MAG: acetyl-CoA carboxylase biotin carboxyl carrier protein [Planctomycetota bacterium]REJ97077.1 MAG: acetyl-CoA carboxylase biotin carboxyl carrier protein [Planctomycetota bacterium]REK20572.1 MAG: acetyl-CoA carboxylase biotin carboxyl carrier protein [Planctomycetota bacterium]REK35103.1 MAG: acetyl-CoA carboxylase biotin carboxyl carrier protein [Planctomycetota bacterium]
MSDDSQESFDLERITKLVELMEQHDLREVKLMRGDQKWILRRGAQEVQPVYSAVPAAAPAPPPVAVPAAQPAASDAPASSGDGTVPITSPMVGTFYRSPSPDDPPFVKVGDKIKHDTVVCLVEAMKFFNQIKAEQSGTIVKILASDGDPVDFGQPLFQVQPE